MSENLSISPEEFDLTPKSVTIKIDGNLYRIKEVTAGVARRYRQSMLEGAAMSDTKDGDKVFRLGTGLASTEITLVAGCLFQLMEDAEGNIIQEKTVTEHTVSNWPDKVIMRLSKIVKELSPNLNDINKEDSESKNSPESTVTG